MPVVQKGRGATNYAQRGMGIKLKEGSGEPSITLIDLTVRNATGTWEASPGYAYKKVTAEVPSPNYIETINGTLANPWGGRFSDIVAMLEDRLNYTVLFKAYGAEVTPDYDGDCIYWAAWFDDVPYSGTPSTASVYTFSYGSDGTLLVSRAWFVNAWNTLDGNANTKITIIHHPLPN